MNQHRQSDSDIIEETLAPFAIEKIRDARHPQTSIRFAHYTSAYAALQIITNKEIWLRNALSMNDYSEIEYGSRCVENALKTPEIRSQLERVLSLAKVSMDKLWEVFLNQQTHRRTNSYMFSLSELEANTPDYDYGKLSMWRAYGGNTNVALILNSKCVTNDSSELQLYGTPVHYCSIDQFKNDVVVLLNRIEKNADLLMNSQQQPLDNMVLQILHFAVLATKHPGFGEENEWRLIHSPTMQSSEYIQSSIETFNEIPQKVFKLKLVDDIHKGLTELDLKNFLEKIIIGPTNSPWLIYDSLVNSLSNAGFSHADKMVSVSEIPLRRQ